MAAPQSAGFGQNSGAFCKKDANKYRAQGESRLRDHWFPQNDDDASVLGFHILQLAVLHQWEKPYLSAGSKL